ncbi:MAG: bifunctional pyr operon transcriptional regulator/uracil phosphoribosyltransferase PyrR [bacterium]
MTKNSKNIEIFGQDVFKRVISRIAHEILERNQDLSSLVLIGIKQGGSFLKERIKKEIENKEGLSLLTGDIDITMYRDDLFRVGYHPKIETTEIPVNLNNKTVILVDDVLFTGRTVRAAMDALFDFGRPKKIQLAVMIDRGHRELPIQADFVGKKLDTSKKEIVDVKFYEKDGVDGVFLRERNAK